MSDYADDTYICLSVCYQIYRVFMGRQYLTYLYGFCLFILKTGVLLAAFPVLCRIMYIFVESSRLYTYICE